MVLESLVALIGGLVLKVGTNVANNIENRIENRIIDAATDAVNQKQLPSLTTLEWSVSDLLKSQRDVQKKQDELLAGQRRQIEMYYKDGISFLGFANTATDKNQKKQFISRAIECFTSASNIEVGEAAAKAALFVGACFYALRRIDHETNVALENHEYERAFLIAENSLGPDKKPPRELLQQLLRLPYLSGKHGTFETYWKKWEPAKRIEPPRTSGTYWKKWEPAKRIEPPEVVEALPGAVPPLSGEKQRFHWTSRRRCISCGKEFDVQSGQFSSPFYCPECSPDRRLLPEAKQHTVRKTCWWCHKEFDASGRSALSPYCPECKSKYHL